MPKKVEFFADGVSIGGGSTRDSSVGFKDIWHTYDLKAKNCSKITMKLTGSTGTVQQDGLSIKLGIRHIKGSNFALHYYSFK